jgi:hypothetical protein
MTASLTRPLLASETRPRAALSESLKPSSGGDDADGTVPDIVDVWGHDSFPASDAPANW